MEVHRQLGCGFLDAVYQEALAIEFELRDLAFEQEKFIDIYYKNRLLKKKYCADFVCFGKVIVELKALANLSGDHEAQLINYLQAAKLEIGLLVNFGAKSLEHKRIVY